MLFINNNYKIDNNKRAKDKWIFYFKYIFYMETAENDSWPTVDMNYWKYYYFEINYVNGTNNAAFAEF